MLTLLSLLRLTPQVLPTSLDPTKLRELNLRSVNIVNFEGTKLKQFNCVGVSSNQHTFYTTRIWFSGLTLPISRAKPSIANSKVLVRCSCPAYFFYCVAANAKMKVQIQGNQFRRYVRKTPPPPTGYPQRNPSLLPCLCKHLVFTTQYLTRAGLIKS